MTLQSVIGDEERKYIDIFTVTGILFLVKISQNIRLISNCVMHMQWFEYLQKVLTYRFQLRKKDTSSTKYLTQLQSQ